MRAGEHKQEEYPSGGALADVLESGEFSKKDCFDWITDKVTRKERERERERKGSRAVSRRLFVFLFLLLLLLLLLFPTPCPDDQIETPHVMEMWLPSSVCRRPVRFPSPLGRSCSSSWRATFESFRASGRWETSSTPPTPALLLLLLRKVLD